MEKMTDIESSMIRPSLEITRPPESESSPTLYYLGPQTFTEVAALKALKDGLIKPETNLIPVSSIKESFMMLTQNGYAIAPIENSTGGHVGDALDCLSRDGMRIIGEIVTPIEQCLYYQLAEEPRIVASKDSALSQSRTWIGRNFPNASLWEVDSTAEAVRIAANEPQVAAIGPRWTGQQWVDEGKLIRVGNVNDDPNNATRFIIVAPSSHEAPKRTGNDKTTLLLTLLDEAGSLCYCLDTLAQNKVNLSQIKSFSRQEGTVQMLITLEGHEEDQNVAEALRTLTQTHVIKSFGSYPKAPALEINQALALSFEELVEIHREEITGSNGNGKNNQTTVAFTLNDETGALRNAVKPFADRGINLTGIDSLPTGILGKYLFYLSFENGRLDHDEVIEELRQHCVELKILEPTNEDGNSALSSIS